MSITFYNVEHQGVVHTPLVVVHGESSYAKSGLVTVSHRSNAFPSLHFEVNSGFFKAVIHLDDGANDLVFTHSKGSVVNGFPQYNTEKHEVGSIGLIINYQPLRNNLPVHLCLLVAKDSPCLFDSTSLKKSFEGNGLDIALKKLRIGGRLMQAYTNEQMLRAGFGNRTFNFYEEVSKETEFYQELNNPKPRNNIKIHVLKSDKTLKELRDPNLAQQNPNGKDTGGLFGIAKDALLKYGGPFNTNKKVQAAVMFLDTHWDNNLKLILTHAALGGGIGNLKLAIFGSHGLYSWPSYLEQVGPCFQDTNESSLNEVANDCNQCSTYWECLNITLGAFMHEIGHLLGCPHQTYGVMLRDYVTLSRSFLTREVKCIRTHSNGFSPVLPKDECKWHRLDLLRFLYHDSFRLPSDVNDPSFGINKPDGSAMILPIGNNEAIVKSNSGIYAIEVYAREIADSFIEFLPLSLGGQGIQNEIKINSYNLKKLLPNDRKNVDDIRINVLCIGGQSDCDKLISKLSNNNDNFVTINGEEINRKGSIRAIKSNCLGQFNQNNHQMVLFDPKTIYNIRVYHGAAVDGLRIDYVKTNGAPPPIPARNYSLSDSFKSLFSQKQLQQPAQQPIVSSVKPENRSVLFGRQTNNYSDLALSSSEALKSFDLKTGAWIDCIQIITSHRVSAKFGNANGGGPGKLGPPDDQFEIVGIFGSVSRWVDSIGIIYAER